MWWILRLSNLDKPVLYELTSPVLLDFLRKWEYGKIDGLHNLPIFDGYFMLPKLCLNSFMANQRGEDVYLSHENAFRTLDPLHNCNREIIIKTCQLHLIINKVANKYGCNYVHLVRHPADVFYSHLGKEYRKDTRLMAICQLKVKDEMVDGAFWMKSIYEKASEHLNVKVKDNDYIGKFVVAWIFCNYNALKQVERSKRGLMIDFRRIAVDPHKSFAELADHLGVKMDVRYCMLLDPSKVSHAPFWLRAKMSDKISELGLMDKYQEIMVKADEA